MKTIREIRDEANALYHKSSHYIAETFISISAIVAIAKGILEVIGAEVGIDVLVILAMFFSPLELGMIKAALLAYDQKAREVKTREFTLLGLKEYGKICVPFVGRTCMIYVLQAVLLLIFLLASGAGANLLPTFLQAVLSGNLDVILQNQNIVLTTGMLGGVILTLIFTFIIEAFFGLSYYYVVEDGMGLLPSIVASCKAMNGQLFRYIAIKLCYIIPTMVASLAVSAITVALSTMFAQLTTVIPGVPLVVFNLILVTITGFVGAFASVMLYKVKETLAITIFYKELREMAE